MKAYKVELVSNSPLLFGRMYSAEVPKESKESPAEYEARTWIGRTHVDAQGNVVIPPLALKNCLRDVARYLGEKIQGKRNATYTKHFKSGVMVLDSMILKTPEGKTIKLDDIEPLWLNVPSDGTTGGTKRVPKAFPQVKQWKGTAEIHVLDETITKDVLERHLIEAGNFIGLGAMRVANGGISGRFKVVSVR
jgi:hypothetical protein